MVICVIVDSNFLMNSVQFNIDVFEEMEKTLNQRIDAVIPSPVYDELKQVSIGRKVKQARQAKQALKMAKKAKIVQVDVEPCESVDDLIVRLAIDWNCLVATNDSELRKKLKKKKASVMYLRQKSHLMVDGATFKQNFK